jgi:F0F1-type ATP synthase membrane subunit b/b'
MENTQTTQNETMIMGNAVIGELEMYGIQLKDELEMAESRIEELKSEIEEMRKSRDFWLDSYNRECKRTAEAKKVSGNAEVLIRNILNETELDDDDENLRELRKIYWDDSDTEKQLKAEYSDCDEEANTAAWYEMNVGV